MSVPEDLKYNKSHEWVRLEAGIATVGITDHAQNELTDIVYVDVPKPGAIVKAGDAAAVVESVKAASDIYTPLSGEIVEGNSALEADPALINNDPYAGGWIFKIKLSDATELDGLLDAESYRAQIGA